MKALVDQQLPVKLAIWLEARGWQAWHVKLLGLVGAADTAIWREATDRDAVIITKDEDFKTILGSKGGTSVIWLRFGNCSNTQLLERLENAWTAIETALQAGERLIEVG